MNLVTVHENHPIVLVVLTTGRPSYRATVTTLARNIERWQPAVSRVDLLVSFDVKPNNATPQTFVEPAPQSLVSAGAVSFAGPDFIESASWLNESEREKLAKISPVTGFGQKKNACLYYALRHGYSHVIFWDDDEFAFHLEPSGNGARWASTDIIGAHVRFDADVTFGFWTGYVSPIPDSFFAQVAHGTREVLTQALGPITDVVSDETFFARAATFCVATAPSEATEIAMTRGGKWISGGNLGVRCAALREGRLPAFYTPTDSRGDDSVFSTGLATARVMQVSAGIFHDAFGTLHTHDVTPGVPASAMPPAASIDRFARVLRGWLAYAPTLTVLRGAPDAEALLEHAARTLQSCDEGLLQYLGSNWLWAPPSQLLRAYMSTATQELEAYKGAQLLWQDLCGSCPQ